MIQIVPARITRVVQFGAFAALETGIEGARAVLLNITGGPDMTLTEVHTASRIVQEATGGDDGADLILGAVIDEKMEGTIRVTVLATGFDADYHSAERARAVRGERGAREERGEAERAAAQTEREERVSAFEDQDLPTYDEDDIDIPAFLRRR